MSGKSDDLLPDLDALAVQEQFLEEWRAGRRPRLSVYARRYPQHAEALAELVAALAPEMPTSEPTAAVAEPSVEPLAESFPERLWSGEGVTRALADIFGDAADERAKLQVAETRAAYQTPQGQDTPASGAQRDEPESD